MATVVGNNQVKLNSGKTIQAQQGGWYDGQQFWGGTLSAPGVINSQSNQQGAGQAVSKEVVAQTNPNNVAYIQKQQQTYQPTSQPAPTATPTSDAGGQGGAGLGITGPQEDGFDPTQFYEQLYSSSGIRDNEADISAKTMAFNEQVSKIKNNPYLSEATMTGRIAKLEQKFNADTQALKNDIAMKKADVETQLNLQLKKIDLNNERTKLAWDQFNSLLSAGALDNASGEDIANITRSTGISSSMIQSAINANKAKNVQTSIIQFDDGTNQGFAVINQQTGEIINRQNVAPSKPKAEKEAKTSDYADMLKADARSGLKLSEIFSIYSGYLTPDQIYQLYNSSSKYGPDTGKISNLEKYGVTQPKSSGRSG